MTDTEFNTQVSNWIFPPTFEWDKASAKVNITAPPCYFTCDSCGSFGNPYPTTCLPIRLGNLNTANNDIFYLALSVSPNFYTLISTFPALITKYFKAVSFIKTS